MWWQLMWCVSVCECVLMRWGRGAKLVCSWCPRTNRQWPVCARKFHEQARYKMRELCARLIRDARAGIEDGRMGADTARRADSRGLPAGAFVQHMLLSDNKLLGRPFTDEEVTTLITARHAAYILWKHAAAVRHFRVIGTSTHRIHAEIPHVI